MNRQNKTFKPFKTEAPEPVPANKSAESQPQKLPARRTDDSSRSRQTQSN